MISLLEARSRIGCWANERWRTECALSPTLSRITGIGWQDLHNRIERLSEGGDAPSRVCDWMGTSELTVCRVFPHTAARLLRRCLHDWPLGCGGLITPEPAAHPRISVIIPVSGVARQAPLVTALASLLRQSIREYEVIVVEQSAEPLLRGVLPAGVQYRHFPNPGGADAFNKSHMMNESVRMAKAPWVLLHDADIVVPHRYLEAILARARGGWEAVRPIRFLFYLDERRSAAFAADAKCPSRIDRVTQNFPGGSTAITRDAYEQMGGHDERFVGWGGEDTEFLDRLRTRRVFPGHFAPALHLWHAPAQKKQSGDRNQKCLDQQMAIPAEERILRLRAVRETATDRGL